MIVYHKRQEISNKTYLKIKVVKGKFNKLPTAARSYITFQGMGIFLSVKASKWLILFAHFCRITTKNTPIPETFLEFHLNAATGRSKRQKDETLQNHEGVSFVFLKRFCRIVRTRSRNPKPKVEKKQKIYPKKRRHYQPFATHYQN